MSSRSARGGQAIVLVAIGMAAFLGFLGLVLDGGRAYLEQRSLQRSADLAALSGAWAYYHSNYQGDNGFGVAVATGETAARDAVDATLRANAYPADASPPAVTFADVADAPVLAATGPGVRRVRVQLQRVLPNQLLGALGAGNPTISAQATAMIGPNTGALHETPLLLQNFTDAGHNVPRQYASCAQAPGDGVRYPLVPTDCRPTTGGPWPQHLNLEPVWNTTDPGGAPVAYFYLLHDPPNQPAGATAVAASVSNGLPSFLPTCPAAPAPCDDATHLVFADTSPPAVDPVLSGIAGRLSAATGDPRWSAQKCAVPDDPSTPLTADNPRLIRLPVSYAAAQPAGSGTQAFKVSETLVFCIDVVVPGAGGDYAISGQMVERPSTDSTFLSPGDPYFGRDVVIRLID
ncbi:MAG: hypothetical protein QOK05_505 [Chloroflexota bacterium]|nr:hypothetical protein [Chloroflexota bacterium]